MKKLDPRIRICPPQAGVRGEICVNGVCFQWPEPLIGFKPQHRGWPQPDFAVPVTLCGGNYGRQLVYEKAEEPYTGNTYFDGEPPVYWLKWITGKYPFAGGEEVCEGFEDRDVWRACFKYNQMVGAGIIPPPEFDMPPSTVSLNDLYMDAGEDAFTRAAYLVNLPKQTDPNVKVVKLYQANSIASFNKYLQQFKDEGWAGAWVRPNDSVWGEAEYFVAEEL